jgi:hypothetical protein
MQMANPLHVAAVKNAPQEHNDDERLDLRGADLSGAELGGAYLREARLWMADLRKANLRGADLSGANLIGADLSGAELVAAELRWADLSGANLRGADLSGADLVGADLREADLGEANMGEANLGKANLRGANFDNVHCISTVFGSVDLSEVKRLDTVSHLGPSTIGVDTLYKSKGKIPEAFLRGCGVPDTLIDFLPSLTGSEKAIEFYSCFISYSHKDEKFAKRLHSRMQEERLRVWYAPEDLKAGEKIYEQIDQAIRIFDKLLLVLSENSMKSEWVITEIRKARKRERESGVRMLFPIRLVDFDTIRQWECFDAGSGKDMAEEIREFFIPDFSSWKHHDSFESAFSRLIADLKAEAKAREKK